LLFEDELDDVGALLLLSGLNLGGVIVLVAVFGLFLKLLL
jgi:hypothetical protein